MPLLDRLAERLDAVLSSLELCTTPTIDRYDGRVEDAYRRLKAGIGVDSDVVVRKLVVAGSPAAVLMVFIDGISDTAAIEAGIVQPLLGTTLPPGEWDEATFTLGDVSRSETWEDILSAIVLGKTVILADGLLFAWVVETAKYPARSISQPKTELSVRGPQEAFNEVLATQKSQLRRKLASPALRFRDITVGRLQQVRLAVAFLDGVTNPSLVDTAARRLAALDVDGVNNATMVAGLIRDHPLSVFPTLRHSERVDVVSWGLLQGDVAILVDGDPFAMVAPAPLISFYRTAMDYSTSWPDASFTRCIRFAGWWTSLYLPALYVAFTQVNPNLLPGQLLVIISGSHAGLPFSPLVEIALMIVIIEILREAAIRLPQMLSTTIGTVGAIVVGTSIVRAGAVDPQIIVLMTMTALALFTTPVYDLVGTWRVLGFALIVGAAILGVLGIIVVTMGIIAVITDMQSFGAPYFAPWAPFRVVEWGDGLIRAPWTLLNTRWTPARPFDLAWRQAADSVPRPHLLRTRRQREGP